MSGTDYPFYTRRKGYYFNELTRNCNDTERSRFYCTNASVPDFSLVTCLVEKESSRIPFCNHVDITGKGR